MASAHTRYHCVTAQPPSLEVVCKYLSKLTRRRGIHGQSEVRSIAARADRGAYSDRGPADDLARFLLNEHILLPNGSKGELFYDAERARTVIAACAAGGCPPPPLDPATRLLEIAPRGFPNLGRAELPEPGVEAVTDVPPPSQPAEGAQEELPTEEGAMSPEAVTTPSPYRFVLYVTKEEFDVWNSLCIQHEVVDGEDRVGIPKDLSVAYKKWRAVSLKCTPEAYRRAVERFLGSGMLEEVGDSGGGHVTYRFKYPPSLFETCLIDMREQRALEEDVLREIRGLQAQYQDLSQPMRSFVEMDNDEDGDISERRCNLFGIPGGLELRCPEERDGGCYGVFRLPFEQGLDMPIAFPGFEPFVMHAKKDVHAEGLKVFFVRTQTGFLPEISISKDMGMTEPEFDDFYHDDGEQNQDYLQDKLAGMSEDELASLQGMLEKTLERAAVWRGAICDRRAHLETVREENRRRAEQIAALEALRMQALAEEEEAKRKQDELRRKREELEAQIKALRSLSQLTVHVDGFFL